MPSIDGIAAGEALTVQWPTGLPALMAFLQPDLLVARLMVAINQIANTPCPWPSASSGSPKPKRKSTDSSAPRKPLSWLRVRHASADARHVVVLGVKAVETRGVRAA
jgi:hypothetical protein